MTPSSQRLVLIGGGHAQVEVLRQWAQHPVPGTELVLIAAELQTPYSGMIPGVIAGHYPVETAHLDLVPLAAAARAVLLHDQATRIDLSRRCVYRQRGGPVPFDVLSLNIGSTPALTDVPGAREFALPVKPIRQLLTGVRRLESSGLPGSQPFRLVLVGSGAAGTEILLALRHRWRNRPEIHWHLIGGESEPLAAFPAAVRRRFLRIFQTQGVQFSGNTRITTVESHQIRSADGRSFAYDALFWAAGAAPPTWIAETGLARDPAGFVAVDAYLQSTSHPAIFASGDCATQLASPCPKAGVFAVRQGPILFENLCRTLRKEPLKPFIPQQRFLAILATGDRHAVACRGAFSLAGRWVWRWKDRIDHRWLNQYRPAPRSGRPPGGG